MRVRRPAKALSMDVDGTLYRVSRLRVAWRLRSHRGLLVALIAAREKIRHEAACAGPSELETREIELIAPAFGLTFEETRAALAVLRPAIPDALTRGVSPFPWVFEALEKAASQGLKLAIFSDYDPALKLRNLGLDGLPWAAKLSADRLGVLKPHARGFRDVAEALGVEPGDVVHVGDREDLDVGGALGAGLRAWRFASKGLSSTRAERVFQRWGPDLFDELV